MICQINVINNNNVQLANTRRENEKLSQNKNQGEGNFNKEIPLIQNIDKKQVMVFQKQKSLIKRICSAALPILLLNSRFKTTYSLIKKTFVVIKRGRRLIHRWNDDGLNNKVIYTLLKTAIAIIILVGTVLSHPIATGLSITQDFRIHIIHLIQAVSDHNLKSLAYAIAQIGYDTFRVAVLFISGAQLNLALGTIKVLIKGYNSAKKFHHHHALKGTGCLIATIVTTANLILA